VSYTKKQIEQFMQLGKPPAPLYLAWTGFESFFDGQVQQILQKFHPDNFAYGADDEKSFPVRVWSIINNVPVPGDEDNWMSLFPFMQRLPVWTSKLLAAVISWRQQEAEQQRNHSTRLSAMAEWRMKRGLRETARLSVSHKDFIRLRTLREQTEKEIAALPKKERELLGVAPVLPEEKINPPKSWMDGGCRPSNRKAMTATYRTAACKENKRRNQIMRHWAECWLPLFSVTRGHKTR
jgi:hypothetical protein